MKIIEANGVKNKMFKPHEVAEILGYNPRTIRRFIQAGTIKAVDSNKAGVQPVWWVPEEEVSRLKKEMIGMTAPKKKKMKPTNKKKRK